MTFLFSAFPDPEPPLSPQPFGAAGLPPLSVTFEDSGRAIRCALEIELESLPSNCECFFMLPASLPHGKFRSGKATRLLGWEPKHDLRGYFARI